MTIACRKREAWSQKLITPYKGVDGKCRYNANKIAAKVTNFTNIPIDEDQMAAQLVHEGPLCGWSKNSLLSFPTHPKWKTRSVHNSSFTSSFLNSY
jgi:hypothetical protein